MKKLLLLLLIVASLAACKKTAPTDENVQVSHKIEVTYPGSVDTYYVIGEITKHDTGCITVLIKDPADKARSFELTTCNPYKIIY